MENVSDTIRRNLESIEADIQASAEKSGRNREQVQLVAVTKYVDHTITKIVFEAGCESLGESRPQDLWSKAASLESLPVRWHLIGHLQRNKAKRTAELTALIESADSIRLLETLNQQASQSAVHVLLEVNVSGEAAKHGFAIDEMESHLEAIASLERVQVNGLMAMAGRGLTAEQTRKQFASLRDLRDRLSRNLPENISLDELSMGMSGDFQLAIEEGATIVRIGSRLFDGIDLQTN